MEIIIQPTPEEASRLAARLVAHALREKPDCVLGMATGGTPVKLYEELVRLHVEEDLDFSRATAFNLDEYVGLPGDHPCSYRYFMEEHLYRHVNISPERVHIPNGMAEDIPAECEMYEAAIRTAGGIDMQILGIGSDGHIGFNEPTSSLASRTRIKTLTDKTRRDNARTFGSVKDVPKHVLTMGVGTIMDSRQVVLLAFGSQKANAIARTVEGPISAMMPASILQTHRVAKIFMDEEAAGLLERKAYYKWVFEGKPDWQKF